MTELLRWWLYDRVVDLHYGGGWRTEVAAKMWAWFGRRWWLIP